MIRTHEAGTLRASQAGERVVLAGWVARRRDHGGGVFLDLRDASGVVQVVVRGSGPGGAGGWSWGVLAGGAGGVAPPLRIVFMTCGPSTASRSTGWCGRGRRGTRILS